MTILDEIKKEIEDVVSKEFILVILKKGVTDREKAISILDEYARLNRESLEEHESRN